MAIANPIDRKTADRVAFNFFLKNKSLRSESLVNLNLVAAPQRFNNLRSSETPVYYVYNNGENGGFVFVSGDDNLPQILGYSLSGTFKVDGMPLHMQKFFEAYQRSMDELIDADPAVIKSVFTPLYDGSVKNSVDALLGDTNWNQDKPWNNKTPRLDNGKQAYVGCVATCMTQIMKYYNWPDQSVGTHSYTENGRTHNTTFGNRYNWDLMPKHVDPYRVSQETADQLATLCADAGLCMDMLYMNFGSGTYLQNAVEGLARNFKYSKNATVESRFLYTKAGWDHLIKKELSEGRPVGFSGASEEIGHAFVCDGYDQRGMFHINWGWGGMNNGNFALDALNPNGTGIGGGTKGGYNFYQEVVIGFVPDKNGSSQWIDPSITSYAFELEGKKSASGDYYDAFSKASFMPWMTSNTAYTCPFRLEMMNENNQNDIVTMPVSSELVMSLSSPVRPFDLPITDFKSLNLKANTTYIVYPAYKKRNGTFGEVRHMPAHISRAKIKTDAGGRVVDIRMVDVSPKLKISNLSADLLSYGSCSVSFTGTNTTEEFLGNVELMFRESGTTKWYPLGSQYQTVPVGSTEFSFKAPCLPLKAGSNCDLLVKPEDLEGTIIEKIPVKPSNAPKGYIVMFKGEENNSKDVIRIDINDISVKGVTLTNLSDTQRQIVSFEGALEYRSGDEFGKKYSLGQVYEILNPNDTKTITLRRSKDPTPIKEIYKKVLEDEKAGRGYVLSVSLVYTNGAYGMPVYEYIPKAVELYDSKVTGVDVVKNDRKFLAYPNPAHDILHIKSQDSKAIGEVFALNGVRVLTFMTDQDGVADVDVRSLDKGIYIVKLLDKVQKIEVR